MKSEHTIFAMTRQSRPLIIFIIVTAIAILAYALFSTDKPVQVAVKKIEVGRVEATVTNTRAGTVKACRRARLSPTTGGQISHLLVQEGDQVQKDQILLKLWNDDLAARVKLAESELPATQAGASQACLVAEEASREADRHFKLYQSKLTSEENLDKARSNAKAKMAGCNAAKAQIRVSEVQIEVARATLERTILRAPFAGTIAEINGELAEFVTPSPIGVPTPPAVDLIDNSCLYITAPIDEVDAPAIKPLMDVRITLDAFPGKIFPGLVQRIAPYVFEVEKQARTVDVETIFANPDDFKDMLPGYSADVMVILDYRDDVLRIPTEAIMEGNQVLVFNESSARLEQRSLKTGLSNWESTEVLSGVNADEWVVISIDQEGVQDGTYATIAQSLAGR